MRKIGIGVIVIFIYLFVSSFQADDPFTIESKKQISGRHTIIIETSLESKTYQYFLYDASQPQFVELEKSEILSAKTYKFKDLSEGKYFIVVQDDNEKPHASFFTLK